MSTSKAVTNTCVPTYVLFIGCMPQSRTVEFKEKYEFFMFMENAWWLFQTGGSNPTPTPRPIPHQQHMKMPTLPLSPASKVISSLSTSKGGTQYLAPQICIPLITLRLSVFSWASTICISSSQNCPSGYILCLIVFGVLKFFFLKKK